MSHLNILVTCPPMLGMIDIFEETAKKYNLDLKAVKVTQTLSEKELIEIIGKFDGWIIGDDPATRKVFEAGLKGSLKAAVKWGVGVDNVDFEACRDLKIKINNTPNMFGSEVADIAMGYVIGLARNTFFIDRKVREGEWPKPQGISLKGKKVGLIGYGDIGRNTAKRLIASDMEVIVYDPYLKNENLDSNIQFSVWPNNIEKVDFIVINCALSSSSYHLLNSESFKIMKEGVRIVNVGRGPIIDENALISALKSGKVHSAALDVFEVEPVNLNSPLKEFENCIFGSHNASNTYDSVIKTSNKALKILSEFLES